MRKIVSITSSACLFLGAGDSLVSCFELAGLVQVLPSLLVYSSMIVLAKGSPAY